MASRGLACLRRSTRLLQPFSLPPGTFPFKHLSPALLGAIRRGVEHPNADAKELCSLSVKRASGRLEALCAEVEGMDGGEGGGERDLDGLVARARGVTTDLVHGANYIIGIFWTQRAKIPMVRGRVDFKETVECPMRHVAGEKEGAFPEWVEAAARVADGRFLRRELEQLVHRTPLNDDEARCLAEAMGVDWQSPEGKAMLLTHSNWLLWVGVCDWQVGVMQPDYGPKQSGYGSGEEALEAIGFYDTVGFRAIHSIMEISTDEEVQQYMGEYYAF